MTRALADYISRFYTPQEYPALAAQIIQWRTTVPLQGVHILDATPVFRNTMVKYYALLCAGARLTVSVGKDIPCDPEIVTILPHFGIRVANAEALAETYDIVADCAGRHCQVNSRYGYVELTRSGLEYYRDFSRPVYSADSGILKLIETSLGTADGFIRAMEKINCGNFKGSKVLIFGGGKVGCGMAVFLKKRGAEVFIAECNRSLMPPEGCSLLFTGNTAEIKDAIAGAGYIIAATGLPGALAEFAPELAASEAVVVNMGVEDEFSAALPESRVLNRKQPLNFILEEPTALRFIDPVMALNNALLQLLSQPETRSHTGIAAPPEELERDILQKVLAAGSIPADMINNICGREMKI